MVLTGFHPAHTYYVDWYDIFTGTLIETNEAINNGGHLVLLYPNLSNNISRPLVAFKLHVPGQVFLTIAEQEALNKFRIDSETDNSSQIENDTTTQFQNLNQFVNTPTLNLKTNYSTEKIELFPNPTQSSVTVKFNGELVDAQISVYNCIGERIIQDKLVNSTFLINLSKYSSGLYYVILTNKNERFVQKVIKND